MYLRLHVRIRGSQSGSSLLLEEQGRSRKGAQATAVGGGKNENERTEQRLRKKAINMEKKTDAKPWKRGEEQHTEKLRGMKNLARDTNEDRVCYRSR